MTLSRRDFFLAGLGALISGCGPSGQGPTRSTADPSHVQWSPIMRRPVRPMPPDLDHAHPHPVTRIPDRPPPPRRPAGPTTLTAIPRSRWAKASPIPDRLNPMRGYQRITVHHEGWTRVWFSDFESTAKRLESIRQSHLERLRAGDIGYHFVIDRAGRIWEGRSLGYQGAHVRGHNAHNIGVMVLGNFNVQNPSDSQLGTLRVTLQTLMRTYRVPLNHVFTHQELNPTTCPGKSLQRAMAGLRSGRHLL